MTLEISRDLECVFKQVLGCGNFIRLRHGVWDTEETNPSLLLSNSTREGVLCFLHFTHTAYVVQQQLTAKLKLLRTEMDHGMPNAHEMQGTRQMR